MSSINNVKQLPLSMWLRQSASFDNYIAAANQQLLNNLRNLVASTQERFLFLWGNEGVGKTHLLQAACRAAASRKGSVYLPLQEADQFAPEMLEGLELMSLVAIDDLDAIAGDLSWETALFNLYNRVRDGDSCSLLVAARKPLVGLGLTLPDLKSRLGWGLVFQVHAMIDEEKVQALQQRADDLGFELPDEVANYLLRHYQRQTAALFNLLDQLDQHSLAEQRRLTIPFVKQVIDSEIENLKEK